MGSGGLFALVAIVLVSVAAAAFFFYMSGENKQLEEISDDTPSSTAEESVVVTEETENAEMTAAPQRSYSKSVVIEEPLVLKDGEVVIVEDAHYIIEENIFLNDSTLVVKNSKLEFRADYPYEISLRADGKSSVVIEKSELNSTENALNWEFRGDSTLVMTDTAKLTQSHPWPWMTFAESTNAVVKNSVFDGTLWDTAEIDMEDSIFFVELVFPAGSSVDQSLNEKISSFEFPDGDSGVSYRLTIRNSTARGWGITILPDSTITIRDANKLVTTLQANYPWEDEVVELSGLKEKFYEDMTWQWGDTTFRFVNVDAWQWSPTAFADNTFIVRESNLADIAWVGQNGKVEIYDSEAFFLRGLDNVRITATDSVIHADVVAKDDSTIFLINTVVKGNIFEEDNGQVYVDGNPFQK